MRWLSTWPHLGLTKTQASGHTWEGFLFIESSEVGRPIPIPGHTSGSNPYKRAWEKDAFAFCLLGLALTGKFICPEAKSFLSSIRVYFFGIRDTLLK